MEPTVHLTSSAQVPGVGVEVARVDQGAGVRAPAPKRKSKSPKCNTTTDDGGIGIVDGAAWLGSASS